jgi:hypothetical protein
MIATKIRMRNQETRRKHIDKEPIIFEVIV